MWYLVIVSNRFCAMSFGVKLRDFFFFPELHKCFYFILYNDCLLDLNKSL